MPSLHPKPTSLHHCNSPDPKDTAAPASGFTPASGLFLSRMYQTLQTEPLRYPVTPPNLALLPTSPSLSVLSPRTSEPRLRAFAYTTSQPGRHFLSIPTSLLLLILYPLLKCHPEEALPQRQWPVTPLHTRTLPCSVQVPSQPRLYTETSRGDG